MSALVDHETSAEAHLAVAEVMSVGDGKLEEALLAQVEATLALVEQQRLLVEQQRLANLIALAHVADTRDAEVSPMEREAWEALGVKGPGTMRPEVREALGLS